jgi:hypothetical protein
MKFAAVLALLAITGLAFLLMWLLWRTRDRWPPVPQWDWPTILKISAFAASVAGAGILTALYWVSHEQRHALLIDLISQLAGGKAQGEQALADIARTLANAWGRDTTIVLVGMLITLTALGWLMTPRRFEVEGPGGFKAKLDGGTPDPSPQVVAAKAAASGAQAVADAVADAKPSAPPPAPEPETPKP